MLVGYPFFYCQKQKDLTKALINAYIQNKIQQAVKPVIIFIKTIYCLLYIVKTCQIFMYHFTTTIWKNAISPKHFIRTYGVQLKDNKSNLFVFYTQNNLTNQQKKN